MPIPVLLHLIACIVVAVGVLFMIPKFFQGEGGYFICKVGSFIAWLGFAVGIALAIIAIFAKTLSLYFLLSIISNALFIFAIAVITPMFFCGDRCQYNALLACLSFLAGFILALLALLLHPEVASILDSISYPLVILGFTIDCILITLRAASLVVLSAGYA